MLGAGSRRVTTRRGRDVERLTHPIDDAVEEIYLDVDAVAGARPFDERGQDSRQSVHPGRDVDDGDADLGGFLGGTRHRDEAGLALNQQIVGSAVGVRAFRAIARDIANHQAWVVAVECLVSQSEARGGSRSQVLNEHVGSFNQTPECCSALATLHV